MTTREKMDKLIYKASKNYGYERDGSAVQMVTAMEDFREGANMFKEEFVEALHELFFISQILPPNALSTRLRKFLSNFNESLDSK